MTRNISYKTLLQVYFARVIYFSETIVLGISSREVARRIRYNRSKLVYIMKYYIIKYAYSIICKDYLHDRSWTPYTGCQVHNISPVKYPGNGATGYIQLRGQKTVVHTICKQLKVFPFLSIKWLSCLCLSCFFSLSLARHLYSSSYWKITSLLKKHKQFYGIRRRQFTLKVNR